MRVSVSVALAVAVAVVNRAKYMSPDRAAGHLVTWSPGYLYRYNSTTWQDEVKESAAKRARCVEEKGELSGLAAEVS